ncbi:MAG: SUMF1/EgtB/PvdO family nonheme iron enzyme, partial [Anaerolineae bacterium]|nr:SUMF1/EgtB/PvdO family nonheme iron enzyme [Anaerolineae bacterium]
QNYSWPWGDEFDSSLVAASGELQPVDSLPAGASPFGLEQMSGNAAEWVADVFDPDFYANSPAANPLGKGPQPDRIYRGGSYRDGDESLFTTSRRATRSNTFRDIDIGLRCAKDAPEATPAAPQAALEAEFCQVYGAYKPGATCP